MKEPLLSRIEFVSKVLSLVAQDAKVQGRQAELIEKLSQLLLDSVSKPWTLNDLVEDMCDIYRNFAGPSITGDPLGSCTINFGDGSPPLCCDDIRESRCLGIPGGVFSQLTCAQLGSGLQAQAR